MLLNRRRPGLDVGVAQSVQLTVGQWLMVRGGGAPVLKAAGRGRARAMLCWLEHLLVRRLIGPIGRLIVGVYQSETNNTLKPHLLAN